MSIITGTSSEFTRAREHTMASIKAKYGST